MFSLENKHKGETVYVVGAGKSIDFYKDEFWQGKTIIGLNQVGKKIPVDYTIRKEGAESYGGVLIRSMWKYGAKNERNHGGYLFDHHSNTLTTINADGLHPYGELFVVSYSTITSALHIAAFMGFKDIYVCGHDCAAIGGETTFSGYYDGERLWDTDADYEKWLSEIAPQTEWVKEFIEDNYNANVIFLQPRMNYA